MLPCFWKVALSCFQLLPSFFRSCFHGYGINHLLTTIQQESSIIFFSLCSTGVNLPASHSHSQGLSATPIVSGIQKSGRVDVYIKDAAHLYTFSLVWGNKREIRLTASLVSPLCSLGWSMPTSRSTRPFLLWISSFPRPKIPATWLSFISVMSLLIQRMPTWVTVWIKLQFAMIGCKQETTSLSILLRFLRF